MFDIIFVEGTIMKKIIRLFVAILLIAAITTSILLLTGCSFSIGNKDSTSTTKNNSNNSSKSKPSTNDSTPSTIVNPNDGDDGNNGNDGDENDEGGTEYTPTPEEIAAQQDRALAKQYEEELESVLTSDFQTYCDSHVCDVNIKTVELVVVDYVSYIVMYGIAGYQTPTKYRTLDYNVNYAASEELVSWFNSTIPSTAMEDSDFYEKFSSEMVKMLADSYCECDTNIHVKVGSASFNYQRMLE